MDANGKKSYFEKWIPNLFILDCSVFFSISNSVAALSKSQLFLTRALWIKKPNKKVDQSQLKTKHAS